MRASKLRIKKVRDKWEITTYAEQARGARRRIGTYKVDKQDIKRVLTDPALLRELGIQSRE